MKKVTSLGNIVASKSKGSPNVTEAVNPRYSATSAQANRDREAAAQKQVRHGANEVFKATVFDYQACMEIGGQCGLEIGMAGLSLVPGAKVIGQGIKSVIKFSKHGDVAVDPVRGVRSYTNLTKPGSIRNIGTDATHTEFTETLTQLGWSSKKLEDGAIEIFENNGAKYVMRKYSRTYKGWSVDFTPRGSSRAILKLRLGYDQ